MNYTKSVLYRPRTDHLITKCMFQGLWDRNNSCLEFVPTRLSTIIACDDQEKSLEDCDILNTCNM